MALATTRVDISSSTPVAVATNVTAISATEQLVGNVRAYVLPTGGTAPTIASPYVEFNGSFEMSGGVAFDVYMWTPAGNATVGVVSE
jgi:hypothetical protein